MNEFLRDRILRRLESLPEERVYQVLDYIEFLESKYATQKAPEPGVVQKLAEGVQDTLRAGQVSAQAISETMGYMSKARSFLAGARAAAESVASDVSGVVKKAVDSARTPVPAAPPAQSPQAPVTPPAPKNTQE
ncbi:MAG TPA: DUF2281 domain-containing protein [Gemmatimonadaceae bacterium]|nr:DUF2281 domain-containing protein [Gemmatimonadaceae bacterium]